MGSEPPRRFDRKSAFRRGSSSSTWVLAGARVISAHDVVARHNDEPATKWPSLELSRGRVAHQKVAPESRDHQRVKRVIHRRSLAELMIACCGRPAAAYFANVSLA